MGGGTQADGPVLTGLDEGEEGPESPGAPPAIRPVGRSGRLLPLAAAMAVCAAVWGAMYVMRVRAHQPNVDDYLYADLAFRLAHHSLVGVFTSALHTGSTSPLVPTLAALLTGGRSVNSIVVVQLLFLMLVVSGAFALARLWLVPVPAAVAAVAAGLNAAVLGYSVMTNFAVPATAAVLWSLACYLRSDRLKRWTWSLGFGAAVAAVLLTRSLAPVYVAPLVALVAVDVVVDLARHRPRPIGPVLAAVAVTLVLAGPWWLVSGRAALHYLTNAGYDTSSGFSSGSGLSSSLVGSRLGTTVRDLGTWEADALAVAAALAVVAVAVRRHAALRSRAWLPVTWSIVTFVLLSTSTNSGTGFGIPVLTVVIVMTAVALMAGPRLPRSLLAPVAALVAAAVIAGVVAEFVGGTSQEWLGPPYRQQVLAAGGSRSTNVERINLQVSRALGTTPTVLARQDPILNANGLKWVVRGRAAGATRVYVPAPGPTGPSSAISALKGSAALVTGTSDGPFPGDPDPYAVQSAALAQGYRAVKLWTVGSGNRIVLMERPGRGRLPALSHLPPSFTGVLQPSTGSVLSGSRYLVAGTRGPLGIASVSFVVSGPGLARPLRLRSAPFLYGWIGRWDTTTVRNGTYALRSVALGLDDRTTTSAPVRVTVDN